MRIEEKEDGIIAFVIAMGFIGLVALLFVYFTIAGGILLSAFWAWFVLPVFPSLPAFGLVQAIGLCMFVGVVRGSLTASIAKAIDAPEKAEKSGLEKALLFFFLIASPWITLLIGYIFKAVFM